MGTMCINTVHTSETTVDILQSHLILKQKIEDVENMGGGGGC